MEYGLLTFKEPENNQNRKIIHIDMDAFYASVEERERPELKNKPVIIAHHPRETGGRGVVTTANYVARQFGVHSAMSAQEAYERCPQAIFISPRMDYYKQVSQSIREVFLEYTDIIEPLSLDEAYLDVTKNNKNIPSATLIARAIQEKVWQKERLTCSAGVSYNKFLAKVASDFQKPAGLTVIPPEKAKDFLMALPIDEFYGVGKKTAERLNQLEIHDGRELYELPLKFLIDEFGKMGFSLYKKVRGIDNQPVKKERERKSIGREHTYGNFLVREDQVDTELRLLASDVMRSLENHKMHGRVVVLKIRYAGFETITRQKSFVEYTSSSEDIYHKALDLWEEHGEIEKEVRLLGITVTQLAPQNYANIQLPLWDTNVF